MTFLSKEYKTFTVTYIGYGIMMLAVLAFIGLDFNRYYWILPGWAIGGIFVIISLLFYNDQILRPKLRSATTSAPSRETNLWQWFLLPLLVQFIITGYFGFTLSTPNLMLGTPYSHAYQYGEIYNRTLYLIKNDAELAKAPAEKGSSYSNDIESFSSAKKKIYETISKESFDPCILKNETNNADSCGDDNPGMSLLLPSEDVTGLQKVSALIDAIPFLIALSFGFVGVLFYILRDVSIRYATEDLYAKTFISYLVRLIFAPSLCAVIAFFLSQDWRSAEAPVLFFMIGYFPQRAMEWMEKLSMKALFIFSSRQINDPSEALYNLQGMDIWMLNRLDDLGIQKIQALALVDFHFIEQNFNTNTQRLADLISQALLLLHTDEDFNTLKQLGVRDMSTLRDVATTKELDAILKSQSPEFQNKLNLLLRKLDTPNLKDRMRELDEFTALAKARQR